MHRRLMSPFNQYTNIYTNNKAFEWCFYTLVVLAWLPGVTNVGNTDLGLSIFVLVILSVFLIVTNYRVLQDSISRYYSRQIIILLGILLLIGVLGIFQVEDYFRSGRFFLSYGQGVVVLLCVTRVASAQTIIKAFKLSGFVFLCTVIIGLMGLIEMVPRDFVYHGTDRLYGFFKNPNQHGMILSMTLCYSVALLLYAKTTVVHILLFIGCVLALLLAGSKTNLAISIILSLLLFAYFMLSRRRYFGFLFLFPLILVIIIFLGLPLLDYLNPRALAILYDFIGGEGLARNSVYQRSFLWLHSYEVLSENPFSGQGPGQRIVVFDQDHSHSHNVLLDSARTLGVPGLILITCIILLVIILCIQTLLAIASGVQIQIAEGFPKAMIVGSAFAAVSYILSNQMSDSFGPSTSIFFWMVLGVLLRRHDLMFGRFEESRILTQELN